MKKGIGKAGCRVVTETQKSQSLFYQGGNQIHNQHLCIQIKTILNGDFIPNEVMSKFKGSG